MQRIAVEEAFATPSLMSALEKIMQEGTGDPAFESIYKKVVNAREMAPLREKLMEFDEIRIGDMDKYGIDVQVLSLTAPGVQVFDAEKANLLASEANNLLLKITSKYPTRYYGLMTVSPTSPDFSVREIERLYKHNNILGIVINSHTKGEYLDNEKFDDILAAAENYSLPIYLHPTTPPPQMASAFQPYGLAGPIWGFAAETALHALRLVLSGVFDKYPRLQIILGHLGEGLPYWLNRLDSRLELSKHFDVTGKVEKLERTPKQYLRENFFFSTSGMNFKHEIDFVCNMCGEDRLLFAIDYPYESTESAINGIEESGFTESRNRKIYHGNAKFAFGNNFLIDEIQLERS